jgi:formylglycine-generating enzyme required for sulfatase activity
MRPQVAVAGLAGPLSALLLAAAVAQEPRSHATAAGTVHDLVLVPAGVFEMGADGGKTDEQPPHEVFLDAYYIDRFEVTNRLYAAFLNHRGRHWDDDGRSFVDLRDSDVQIRIEPGLGYAVSSADAANRPVVEVSWLGAEAYCRWAGMRLPSEAMWEKAARGTDGRTYPWGEGISRDRANYGREGCCGGDDADGYHFSAPVGSYAGGISPYGVHDMAGNVWEFVSDWYDEDFYACSPMRNPEGPDSGLVRVLRGGSFGSDPRRLRTTDRSGLPPTPSYLLIGFRCAVAASSLPATAIRPLSWGVVKREAR